MARVNHKTVRQLIAQKRKTITDRQFFSSRLLAGHFEDLAAAQTRRYGYSRGIRVRTVWAPKDNDIAHTNNELIWINAGHPMVTAKRTRVDRYDLVCGLFAHELGHVLYTDFLIKQSYILYLRSERWYPEAPLLRNRDERMNEADLWVYAKSDPKKMMALLKLACHLWNILEDGYIEGKMLNSYPGVLGYSLESWRTNQFEEQPTLTQAIEAESENGHIWQTVMQLMLSYVLFGELKYGEEPLTDERVQMVFSLLPELDRALTEPSAKDRWDVVNIILVRCWPYIKDFLELCEKLAEEAEASGSGGDGNLSDILAGLLSALAGASGEAEGETAPVDGAAGSPSAATAAPKRAATAKQAAASAKSGSEDGTGEGDGEEPSPSSETGEEAGSDEPDETGAGDMAAAEDDSSVCPPMSGASGGEAQEVSAEEGGRIPLEQTDDLYAPAGGETTHDNDYAGSGYAGSAGDIERLLENMAERAAATQLETERISELGDLANSISYGDIHDGVNKKIHRFAAVGDELKDEFHLVAGPLLHISKLLQRSVSQQLKDKRSGGKQTGLLMGRRLDAHALPRNDGRVFYKNALPVEAPEMAVGLLLDESGSMCCNDRATYARATAIILYDFCRALRIPIMVYGHSTSGNTVDLYSYAEFDSIDGDDRYRMMDISARGGNRDGAALRYIAERLSRRSEEVKMLILVSDGQPADDGYYGTAAEEDLRGIKREYTRKGILFVAAAIGDDKANIERIYGDAFMDITDLNKLPVALTNVVKRHMRV